MYGGSDMMGARYERRARVLPYVYGGVTNTGVDDFLVASYGRDKAMTAIAFDPLNPATAYFPITGMVSFDNDLVNWSGSWIHAPKSAQLGQGT